jgi:hypothetical protein
VAERLAHKARQAEEAIVRRLRQTDDRTRTSFPLWDMARVFHLVPELTEVVPPSASAEFDKLPHHRDTGLIDILLLALVVDRFPRYATAFAAVGEVNGLTIGTIVATLQPEEPPTAARWDLFDRASPLVANGFVELGTADTPLGRRIRIDPRTADHLLGLPAREPELPGACVVSVPRTWDHLRLDPETLVLLRRLSTGWWERQHPLRLMLLFHGPHGSPLLHAAQAFLTTTGKRYPRAVPLLVIHTPKAMKAPDWGWLVRRVYREALFRRIPVFWESAEGLLATDQPLSRWETLVHHAELLPYPTFVGSDAPWDPVRSFDQVDHYFIRVEFPIPSPQTRRKVWRNALARERNPLAGDDTADRKTALDLLESFPFTEGQVEDAVATARGLALAATPASPVATPEQLYEGCRRQSARRLISFAQRIQPRPGQYQLSDVVLPPPAALQLQELLVRMKALTRVYHNLGFEHRLSLGRGLVVLFTGPSGTGKTHAATVLASLVSKDLYKVDVAAVVSKFVGETEKNLNRVFADAQDANAVLFFDEADALFGKRGEVEQGQDRWANLEVNFLLQRVEEYTGTVILATNYRQNIDNAFLRRVQVLLEFSKPDAAARFGILKRMFPQEVARPNDDDLRKIAGLFDLTGGNLKNAVLDAAFRAAAVATQDNKVVITTNELVLGIAREYQKLGLPITAATFTRPYHDLVVKELLIGGRPSQQAAEPTVPLRSRRASG